MKKALSVILACLMVLPVLCMTAFAADSYTKTFSVILEPDASDRVEFVHIDPADLEGKVTGQASDYATELYVAEKKDYITGTSYSANLDDYNSVVIALRGKGSFAPDQTATVKVFPSTYEVDIINGKEYGDRLPDTLMATLGEDAYTKQNYGEALIIVGNKANTLPGDKESIPADFTVLTDKDGDPINEKGEKLNKITREDGTIRELTIDQYASKIIYIYRFYNVTEDIVVRVFNVEMDSVSGAKSFVMNLIDFFRQLIEWFFGLFR